MDFGRAFSFVFQDPDWLKKVGIAALVFLIPFVGPIILMGWGLEITRRVINNNPDALPGWDNFSDFISKGFQAFVVSLAYALPSVLIIICGQTVTLGLASATSNSDSTAMDGIFAVVLFGMICVATIFLIASGFFIPAATGKLAVSGDLGSAFRFNEVFALVRAAPGPYILLILGVALANIVLAPLGTLACGIGVLITSAYSTAFGGHLTGQAYNAAQTAPPTTTSL